MGLNYTDEGLKLIQLIISKMNIKRLSISVAVADKKHIDGEVKLLLSGPSNYDNRGYIIVPYGAGDDSFVSLGIWIISKNKFINEKRCKQV